MQPQILESCALDLGEQGPIGDAERVHDGFDEFACHQQPFAGVVQFEFNQRVVELRMHRDRTVRRQCPGSRGPDGDRGRHIDQQVALVGECIDEALRQIGAVDHLEAHVDARGGLVLVLDLRLGQRRAAIQAPMHRLVALVHVAVLDDDREGAQLFGFVSRHHGQVRMIPITEDAQALEIGALRIHLLVRVLAAGRAKRFGLDFLSHPAMRFLHLHLNGQPVAIPAGHIRRIVAIERA